MTDVKTELPASLKPVPPMAESDMQLAEQASLRYRVTPKPGIGADDLLRPEYWAHVSKRLPPLSEIRAICQDGTWMADYIVLNSGPNWAKVMKLAEWRLDDSAPAAVTGEYEIEWAGPVHKWRVVRSVEGKKDVLKYGFADEAAAGLWRREHAKAIGR